MKEHIFHENYGFLQKFCEYFREIKKVSTLEVEIREKLIAKNRNPDCFFKAFRTIQKSIKCAHNPSHALSFLLQMLLQEENGILYPNACFVEAGCFKGGSSAKFSLFASLLDKKLILFDSFEGLPDNDESHESSVQGYSIKGWFQSGNFMGSLEEVQNNIEKYGKIDVCEFHKGWFCNTMPQFSTPVLAAYLDVDLASSTEDCLKYLYPLLVPGGVIVSQDGDFPLVIDVINSPDKWSGTDNPAPIVKNIGQKITTIHKPLG